MKRNLSLAAYVAGLVLSAVYLVNPGAGMIELLPDALPLVGNLDEAGMTALLLACLRALSQHRQERLALEATSAP